VKREDGGKTQTKKKKKKKKPKKKSLVKKLHPSPHHYGMTHPLIKRARKRDSEKKKKTPTPGNDEWQTKSTSASPHTSP